MTSPIEVPLPDNHFDPPPRPREEINSLKVIEFNNSQKLENLDYQILSIRNQLHNNVELEKEMFNLLLKIASFKDTPGVENPLLATLISEIAEYVQRINPWRI